MDQVAQVSRRQVLRQLALAITAAGSGAFNLEAARVVHALAGEERQAGGYRLKRLTEHEFATVSRLAELIVPADAGGGSGVDAGAPEFIDLLCSQNDELADIYQGVGWPGSTPRRASATAPASSMHRRGGRPPCSTRWSTPSGLSEPAGPRPATSAQASSSSPGSDG